MVSPVAAAASIFLFVHIVSPAKILVYNPLFAQSHSKFMSAIGRILTEEGHQVTVLSPVLDPNVKLDAEKFTKVAMVTLPPEIFDFLKEVVIDYDVWNYNNYNVLKINKMASRTAKMMAASCRELLSREDILAELRKEKFDVGISEYIDACGTGIFHLLGVNKTILATSTIFVDFQLEDFGIPRAPSFVPTMDSDIPANELANSIWARAKNAYLSTAMSWIYRGVVRAIQEVFDDRVPEFPRFSELAANSSLIFTNSNPLIDFARPVLHKVVDISGIHLVEEKSSSKTKLSEEWQEILSRRSRNVLISFGSVAQSALMLNSKKIAIVEMARSFPDVTFIWKYEKPEDEVGRGVENLVKVAWTPQNELLQSGSVTVFLTHGGMGSINEGINAGVPLLLVGLFSEQLRNAAMMSSHGSALALDKWRLDEPEYLQNTMRKLLEDSSYAENARRLAAQLKARPFSARELLVRHTAFVAEHGPLHQMTPVSTKMNVLQRHLVDIFAILFAASAILLFIAVRVIKSLFTNNKAKHHKSE